MVFVSIISYLFAVSAVFSCGIGLNFLLLPKKCVNARLFKNTIKMTVAAILSTAVLWLPFSVPRLAAALSGLLPLAAAAVSYALCKALSILLPDAFTDRRLEIQEVLFVFSAALLSIKEGLNFPDALLACLSCCASFALFLFLMIAAFSRLESLRIPQNRAGLSLALVLLGIFSLILPLFDIIWSHSPSIG